MALDERAIEERVQRIVAEKLGRTAQQVVSTAAFIDDLDADSLDIVELMIAMEREFDVEIPDEQAEKLRTVGDASRYIYNVLN
ncbi:MAG: acyl carrier protein [Myxococcota bacterium]